MISILQTPSFYNICKKMFKLKWYNKIYLQNYYLMVKECEIVTINTYNKYNGQLLCR